MQPISLAMHIVNLDTLTNLVYYTYHPIVIYGVDKFIKNFLWQCYNERKTLNQLYTTRIHLLGGRKSFTASTLSDSTEYNRTCFSICKAFSSTIVRLQSQLDTTDGLFDMTAAKTASGTW